MKLVSDRILCDVVGVRLDRRIAEALCKGPLYKYIKMDFMKGRLSEKAAIHKIMKINRHFFHSSCPQELLKPSGYVRSWEMERKKKKESSMKILPINTCLACKYRSLGTVEISTSVLLYEKRTNYLHRS